MNAVSTSPARLLPLLLVFLIPVHAHARDGSPEADSAEISRSTMTRAATYTLAYYAGSLFVLGNTWYRGREVVPFHFYNDNRAYMQVDKLGHAFGSYVYSYIGYRYLRARLSRKEALLFGATLGLVLQTPIEIMDGVHEGYGFSWGDMAANATGSLFVLGQEVLVGEQIAKMKFSYWESPYARRANGYLGKNALDRLFSDYNGHTYWISLPVSWLWRDEGIPAWLSVAVGYGAAGMYGEFENLSVHEGVALPEAVRYRQFLVSLDIDWTRVKTDSRLLGLFLKAATFVKLPFPALEYNAKGRLNGHWMYF